jgi:hypothetical protein
MKTRTIILRNGLKDTFMISTYEIPLTVQITVPSHLYALPVLRIILGDVAGSPQSGDSAQAFPK